MGKLKVSDEVIQQKAEELMRLTRNSGRTALIIIAGDDEKNAEKTRVLTGIDGRIKDIARSIISAAENDEDLASIITVTAKYLTNKESINNQN